MFPFLSNASVFPSSLTIALNFLSGMTFVKDKTKLSLAPTIRPYTLVPHAHSPPSASMANPSFPKATNLTSVETCTGTKLGLRFPLPICPAIPHDHKYPSLSIAYVHELPAHTETNSTPSAMLIGYFGLVFVPSPSKPRLLLPHAHSFPVSSTANHRFSYTEIDTKPIVVCIIFSEVSVCAPTAPLAVQSFPSMSIASI